MTYRFVGNLLTHCATLLDNNLGKEKDYEIIIDFIVDFNRKYVAYNIEVPHITLNFALLRHGKISPFTSLYMYLQLPYFL